MKNYIAFLRYKSDVKFYVAFTTEFKKDKLNRLLKSLIQKNYIAVTGKGRGTKYFKR